MNKFKIYISFTILSLIFVSCVSKQTTEKAVDYSKYFKVSPAIQAPTDPGASFTPIPEAPGDLGFTLEKRIVPTVKTKYTITIHLEIDLQKYNQDKSNYTEAILQYIGEDNKLKVDTLLNKSNHTPDGKEYYPSIPDIKIVKYSGDPAYFAFFFSPYGNCYLALSYYVNVGDENGDELFSYSQEYDKRQESFHITQQGQEFFIWSKALYLP